MYSEKSKVTFKEADSYEWGKRVFRVFVGNRSHKREVGRIEEAGESILGARSKYYIEIDDRGSFRGEFSITAAKAACKAQLAGTVLVGTTRWDNYEDDEYIVAAWDTNGRSIFDDR